MDNNEILRIAAHADMYSAAGHAALGRGELTLANHYWAAASALCSLLMHVTNNPHYDPKTREIDA
jgi:hypothetical protein